MISAWCCSTRLTRFRSGTGFPLNLAAASCEALCQVAGIHDNDLIDRTGANHRHFTYAPEVIEECMYALMDDQHTLDAIAGPNQFFIRESKMELHTHVSSMNVVNDVNDLFAYTQLQLSFARIFALDVGPYHHHVSSFRLSADAVGMMDKMHLTKQLTRPADLPRALGNDGGDRPPGPRLPPEPSSCSTLHRVVSTRE